MVNYTCTALNAKIVKWENNLQTDSSPKMRFNLRVFRYSIRTVQGRLDRALHHKIARCGNRDRKKIQKLYGNGISDLETVPSSS